MRPALLALALTACAVPPSPPVVESWVITSLSLPPLDAEGNAPGLDLDGQSSTGGRWCDGVPDRLSTLTGASVDNALAAALDAWPSPDFDRWIAGEIAAGRFVLVVERTEWGDRRVKGPGPWRRMRVVLARSPSPPLLDAAGRLAPDQTFDEVMELAVLEGLADEPRWHVVASLDTLELPIARGDRRATVSLHDVHLELFTDLGWGQLGAHVTVDQLLAAHAALGAPIDEATLRSRVTPDLAPNVDGSVCGAISLGMALEAVPAVLAPSGV